MVAVLNNPPLSCHTAVVFSMYFKCNELIICIVLYIVLIKVLQTELEFYSIQFFLNSRGDKNMRDRLIKCKMNKSKGSNY